MKTIRQINEIAHNWNEGSRDFAIRSLCDALIGITEYLEAQSERSDDTIRREAMLKALRWADRATQSDGVEYSAINRAITRLENGGDL